MARWKIADARCGLNIILNNILKKKVTQNMVHASFYYPVKDGSQFIINRLSENTWYRNGFGC
jgi:hypothetical protein